MSESNFKDLYNMGEEYVFSGLSDTSIDFLRDEGLWSPIDQNLLENLPELSNKLDLIYLSRTDKDVLMFLLIEQGEFLQGKVYDLIYEEGQLPIPLHEYRLVDCTTVREDEQLVVDDNLFLYLYNENSVIGEWTVEEVEEYLVLYG